MAQHGSDLKTQGCLGKFLPRKVALLQPEQESGAALPLYCWVKSG